MDSVLLAFARVNLAIAGAVLLVLFLRPALLRAFGSLPLLWAAPPAAAVGVIVKPRGRTPTPTMDQVLALAYGRSPFSIEGWLRAHHEILAALWLAGLVLALGLSLWPWRRALLGAGWAAGSSQERGGLVAIAVQDAAAPVGRLERARLLSQTELAAAALRGVFWFNPIVRLGLTAARADLLEPAAPSAASRLGAAVAAALVLATGWSAWALQPPRPPGGGLSPLTTPRPERPGLRIVHAAVRLLVVPEDRSDVVVSGGGSAVEVSTNGLQVVIEGRGALPACADAGARLPLLEVHTPREVRVVADGVVHGAVGPAESVALAASGCGDWAVARTQRRLALAARGAARIAADQPGEALLAAAADRGDITVDGVSVASADLENTGAGRLSWSGAATRLKVALWGAGDIDAGRFLVGMDAALPGTGRVCYARYDESRNCVRGETVDR